MVKRLSGYAIVALVLFTPCAEASAHTQGVPTALPLPAIEDASDGVRETGRVSGIVLDASGAAVAGAQVSLLHNEGRLLQTLTSGAQGEFAFEAVPSGFWRVKAAAAGFTPFETPDFAITAQQVYVVPDISLSISPVTADVTVRPTEVIAAEQIKAAREQRLFGGFPNFYVSYVPDAAPLTPRQKLSLAAWDTFDWSSLQGAAIRAGLEQATNAHAGYGQGMSGYGKRWAAVMAGQVSRDLLSHYVFASALHQDPRYFHKGTGTRRARFLYALGSVVIARSDSGKPMPNYAYLLGDMSSAALANAWYPRADRSVRGIFVNAAIGMAGRAAQAVMRELVEKRPTRP
jgi:hypothetical protein